MLVYTNFHPGDQKGFNEGGFRTNLKVVIFFTSNLGNTFSMFNGLKKGTLFQKGDLAKFRKGGGLKKVTLKLQRRLTLS